MVHFTVVSLAKAAGRAIPRLRRAPITLTDAATERVKDLLSRRQKVPGVLFVHIVLPSCTSCTTTVCRLTQRMFCRNT